MANTTHPLSRREVEVLQRIADGLTRSQIARAVGMSPGGLDNLLSRVYRRFGVANATAALMAALRGGLVEVPGVRITGEDDRG